MFGGWKTITVQNGFGRNVSFTTIPGVPATCGPTGRETLLSASRRMTMGVGTSVTAAAVWISPTPFTALQQLRFLKEGKISTSGPQSAARRCELGGSGVMP